MFIKHKHFFSAVIFLISIQITTAPIYAQTKVTLQGAIDLTLKNNLQIKKAVLGVVADSLDVLKAKVSIYPNLNASISGNQYFGRSLDPTTNLYLTQNAFSSTDNLASNVILFQGFQKINQIKQNKFILESNKSNIKKLKNDLTIQVISNYLAVMNYTDQLLTAKQQNELAKQLLDIESKKFDAGKKSITDLSKAKSQVTKTEVNVSTIKSQLNNSIIELKQLMNEDPNVTLEFVEPTGNTLSPKEHAVAEIYKYAVSVFPEIKKAEFLKQSAEAGLSIAKGGYYPAISLNSVVATNYLYQYHFTPSLFGPYSQSPFFKQLHSNLYGYIGLALNIPIFNNLNVKMAVKKAKLDLEGVTIDEQIAKNNLYKIIAQATSDLEAAEKNYADAQQSVATAKDLFNVMQRRYQSGSSNSFDFNQAQNDLNTAQFTLIYDKYDLIFKEKVIDFYSGQPIAY